MYHDERTDHTGGHTPGSLVYRLQLVVLIKELHIEGLREIRTEVVGGRTLKCLTIMHESLDGISSYGTGKLLLLGLLSLYDRDRKHVLRDVRIDLEHKLRSLLSLLRGCMHGMSLLPQELTGSQERTGGLLPTNDRDPLVEDLREITIGLYDL